MHELANTEKSEPTLIDGVVSEFPAHNSYWVKEGAILAPLGDLHGGAYFGPDKYLFQICLEIRAISWKMTELRLKMGQKPTTSAEPNPSASFELNGWNIRCNEYFGFCNVAMPLFESRLARLVDLVPHTLHGLAAKAALIMTECVADDETTGTKLVRSILRNIADLMGVDT